MPPRVLQLPNYFAEPEPALAERSNLVSISVSGVQLDRCSACAFPALGCVRVSWSGDDEDGRRSVFGALPGRRGFDEQRAAQLAFVADTPHALLDLESDSHSKLAPLLASADAGRRVGTLRLYSADVLQLRALRYVVPELRRLEISGELRSGRTPG